MRELHAKGGISQQDMDTQEMQLKIATTRAASIAIALFGLSKSESIPHPVNRTAIQKILMNNVFSIFPPFSLF